MEYGNFNFIYILVALLGIVIVLKGYLKKKKIKKLIGYEKKNRTEITKIVLFIMGLIFIVVSLFDPQREKGEISINAEGLDIYVLFDISNSMLAEDVKPNRLEKSKLVVGNILDNLKGDRVGFIPFSSTAFIQMPLTDDYDMARSFLDVIDSSLIYGGGTNIDKALSLASNSFKNSDSRDSVVLIVSDGEANSVKENIVKKYENIKIYTMAVGTKKGSVIPNLDELGKKNGFLKDKNGKTVISKTDEKLLSDIAKNGGGKNYTITNRSFPGKNFVNDINSLQRGKIEERKEKQYMKYYQYFLLIGIILLMLGHLVGRRGNEE